VAPEHPWVSEHPEYFIQGTPEEALPGYQFPIQGHFIRLRQDTLSRFGGTAGRNGKATAP
jgi:hypothetical protein